MMHHILFYLILKLNGDGIKDYIKICYDNGCNGKYATIYINNEDCGGVEYYYGGYIVDLNENDDEVEFVVENHDYRDMLLSIFKKDGQINTFFENTLIVY